MPTIDGTTGADSLVGTSDNDTIRGLEGDDSLVGGGGDDALSGGPGANTIDAGDGNDAIWVSGSDFVYGRDGADTVVAYGAAGLHFYGEAGNDRLDLASAAVLSRSRGEHSYFTDLGAGDDTLTFTIADYGASTVIGGDGNDRLLIVGEKFDPVSPNAPPPGGYAIVTIDAGDGQDFVGVSGRGEFNIHLGAGSDTVTYAYTNEVGVTDSVVDDFNPAEDAVVLDGPVRLVQRGVDTILQREDIINAGGAVIVTSFGGWSDKIRLENVDALAVRALPSNSNVIIDMRPWLVGTDQADTLTTDAGFHRLDGDVGDDSLQGGVGDDELIGGDGADTMDGGGGQDRISGGSGASLIFGGDGDDTLRAESGTISGGAGRDLIQVGPGPNILDGDAGNDTIWAGDGPDTVRGLDDDDVIDGAGGDDSLNGNRGQDIVNGDDGADQVLGGQGNDIVNGGSNDDPHVNGNIGDDTVSGGGGADTVFGGQGNDRVFGDDGNDYLSGDLGSDTLTGGPGADTFHLGFNSGHDVVTDFDASAGDRVLLDHGATYTVTQSGPDTVVTLETGEQLTLLGVSATSLPAGWLVVS